MAKIIPGLTDLEIYKFTTITDTTLRNWKRPLKKENGEEYYPPFGRHNAYKGVAISTYLLKYPDNGEEVEHYNNMEILKSNTEVLEDYLKMLNREDLEENIKKSLLKSALDSATKIKEIIGNLPN